MTRVAHALLALVFVAALGADAQLVGISLVQQSADTKVVNITCDEVQGFFTVTFFNGFTDTRTFYLQGQTDGVGSPLNPIPTQWPVPPRTQYQLYLFGPNTGSQGTRSIVGKRSHITTLMVDPLSSLPQIINDGSQNIVCGDSFSSPCNCSACNVFCQLDDCSPETYACFWFILCLLIASLTSCFCLLPHAAKKISWGNKMDHMSARMNTTMPTKEESSENALRAKYRKGEISEDQIRANRADLERQLQSPDAQNILRREIDIAHDYGAMSSGAFNEDDELVSDGTLLQSVASSRCISPNPFLFTGIEMKNLLPMHSQNTTYRRMAANGQSLR